MQLVEEGVDVDQQVVAHRIQFVEEIEAPFADAQRLEVARGQHDDPQGQHERRAEKGESVLRENTEQADRQEQGDHRREQQQHQQACVELVKGAQAQSDEQGIETELAGPDAAFIQSER